MALDPREEFEGLLQESLERDGLFGNALKLIQHQIGVPVGHCIEGQGSGLKALDCETVGYEVSLVLEPGLLMT